MGSRVSGGAFASLLVVAVASQGTALAQAVEEDAVAVLELPEITVFGGARDERGLLETPNAVSVIERDEILRRRPSSFEELIGDLPGVTIEGGPRAIAQEPNIRGFQDEQIVIRVDGARQNFDLAHRGRFFTDPLILKRVEVLRGGQSTLFGSGALGGVIFLDTRDAADVLDPDQTAGGEITLGYDSQGDEFLGAGTVAARAGDFDALAFFSGRPRFSDLEDGDGTPIRNSEIDSQNGLLKLGWEPGGGHRVETSYQIFRDSGETPPNANVQGTPTTVVDRDLRYQTGRLGWEWDATDDPLIDLTLLAYVNDTRVEEDRLFDGRFDTTEFQTIGVDAANVSRFQIAGLPVAVSYGAEAFRDRQEARRDGELRVQSPDATRRFFAGFVQADVEVTPSLTITPGIRYDFFQLRPDRAFEDRDEGEPSPKLAVNWRPTEGLQFFASASRSFRAPTLTELYVDGVHFAVDPFPLGPPGSGAPFFNGVNEFVPSPDLEPERATQVEAGARWRMDDLALAGDRLALSGVGYFARVDDFVDQVVFLIDESTTRFNPATRRLEVSGTTRNRNVDARLFGFEGEADYDAGLFFGAASVTIPRGEARDGGELASIPQDRLVLTGGVRPIPDVEIGLRGTFARGQDDVPEGAVATPGFSVFDVFANWQPSTGPLAGAVLSAGIDNLTDRAFRVHPSGLNSPGLAVKLAATVPF